LIKGDLEMPDPEFAIIGGVRFPIVPGSFQVVDAPMEDPPDVNPTPDPVITGTMTFTVDDPERFKEFLAVLDAKSEADRMERLRLVAEAVAEIAAKGVADIEAAADSWRDRPPLL
jgi:hypothetical protein